MPCAMCMKAIPAGTGGAFTPPWTKTPIDLCDVDLENMKRLAFAGAMSLAEMGVPPARILQGVQVAKELGAVYRGVAGLLKSLRAPA